MLFVFVLVLGMMAGNAQALFESGKVPTVAELANVIPQALKEGRVPDSVVQAVKTLEPLVAARKRQDQDRASSVAAVCQPILQAPASPCRTEMLSFCNITVSCELFSAFKLADVSDPTAAKEYCSSHAGCTNLVAAAAGRTKEVCSAEGVEVPAAAEAVIKSFTKLANFVGLRCLSHQGELCLDKFTGIVKQFETLDQLAPLQEQEAHLQSVCHPCVRIAAQYFADNRVDLSSADGRARTPQEIEQEAKNLGFLALPCLKRVDDESKNCVATFVEMQVLFNSSHPTTAAMTEAEVGRRMQDITCQADRCAARAFQEVVYIDPTKEEELSFVTTSGFCSQDGSGAKCFRKVQNFFEAEDADFGLVSDCPQGDLSLQNATCSAGCKKFATSVAKQGGCCFRAWAESQEKLGGENSADTIYSFIKDDCQVSSGDLVESIAGTACAEVCLKSDFTVLVPNFSPKFYRTDKPRFQNLIRKDLALYLGSAPGRIQLTDKTPTTGATEVLFDVTFCMDTQNFVAGAQKLMAQEFFEDNMEWKYLSDLPVARARVNPTEAMVPTFERVQLEFTDDADKCAQAFKALALADAGATPSKQLLRHFTKDANPMEVFGHVQGLCGTQEGKRLRDLTREIFKECTLNTVDDIGRARRLSPLEAQGMALMRAFSVMCVKDPDDPTKFCFQNVIDLASSADGLFNKTKTAEERKALFDASKCTKCTRNVFARMVAVDFFAGMPKDFNVGLSILQLMCQPHADDSSEVCGEAVIDGFAAGEVREEAERVATANDEEVAPETLFPVLDHLCAENMCGMRVLKAMARFEKGADNLLRSSQNFCSKHESGKTCIQVGFEQFTNGGVDSVVEACPQPGPQATCPGEPDSTCQGAVSTFVTNTGCCTKPFLRLVTQEDGPEKFTEVFNWVSGETQCNVNVPDACALNKVQRRVRIFNLKRAFVLANRDLMVAKLKKAIAQKLGLLEEAVTVTDETTASDEDMRRKRDMSDDDEVPFEASVQVDVPPELEGAMTSVLGDGDVPFDTSDVPSSALVDPLKGVTTQNLDEDFVALPDPDDDGGDGNGNGNGNGGPGDGSGATKSLVSLALVVIGAIVSMLL